MQKAKYFSGLGDKVLCSLCPNRCIIADGQLGACKVRLNKGNTLYTTSYGKLAAVSADPIEKKPLYHFLPGSYSFSVGTAGCNLFCRHCQNWEIARASSSDIKTISLSPEEVVELALKHKCESISYTYNEPTVFFEFVIDCAKIARKKGLKNIIVTNGYISEEPAKELMQHIDAANIDLKAFNSSFYKNICSGSLDHVLKIIKLFKEKLWIELTNLIINSHNDSLKEISEMAKWIADELGKETPLHFSRAFPMYQMKNIEPTKIRTLQLAKKEAERFLDYVYIGNTSLKEENNSYCPECKALLIKRDFYLIEKLFDKHCKNCSKKIAGVFE